MEMPRGNLAVEAIQHSLQYAADTESHILDALGSVAKAGALAEFDGLQQEDIELAVDIAETLGWLRNMLAQSAPVTGVDETPVVLRLAAVDGELIDFDDDEIEDDVYSLADDFDDGDESVEGIVEIPMGTMDDLDDLVLQDLDYAELEDDDENGEVADELPGLPQARSQHAAAQITKPANTNAGKSSQEAVKNPQATKFLEHLMTSVPMTKTDIPKEYRRTHNAVISDVPPDHSRPEVSYGYGRAMELHKQGILLPKRVRSTEPAWSRGLDDLDDLSWQCAANCLGVDPELFFPDRGASTKEAKAVCMGCEVRSDCLEYALANGEKFGIWGGLSERERRRIRRQRALARAAMQPSS